MKTLGLILLVFGFASGAANAMTFIAPKHNPPDVITWMDQHGYVTRIYADGEITAATADELEQFVRANHIDSGMVLFNSPGGLLMGGVTLGTGVRQFRCKKREFREPHRVTARVSAGCPIKSCGGTSWRLDAIVELRIGCGNVEACT